ncbi:hypothetical protein MNBD_GAMMA22-2815 [hydrothermal vent metagenome]|uniref:Uncharacterized protein n=1 Tax=hydrothermal vent metagenome TaxID=652676 RepID=A0A3B0ZED0_9ZZZZ
MTPTISDEAVLAEQAINKGTHKTKGMRQLYVKKKIPIVVRNNIKRLP